MTFASWEFNSLTIMLIGTHGDDAEAARRLEAATQRDDRDQMVVWREVSKRLADLTAQQSGKRQHCGLQGGGGTGASGPRYSRAWDLLRHRP
jgi:hypothetical protein